MLRRFFCGLRLAVDGVTEPLLLFGIHGELLESGTGRVLQVSPSSAFPNPVASAGRHPAAASRAGTR
jgi:hypothetical protein